MSSKTTILFSLFQKLDYRDKDNSGKKKLLGILLAYLISNTILAYNFYLTFDEKSFVILALTSNLFLISLIVLSDFDNLFLANRSYDLLATLPVRSSQFILSKFLSAALFLAFFIFASAIPQLIFFYLIDHDPLKIILYLITNFMFCFFTVGVLVFIYLFVFNYLTSKATLILNIIQILFFIFIFYATTLSSRIASQPLEFFLKKSILNYDFVNYLPQTFFANSIYNIYYFVFCLLITSVILYLLFSFLSFAYFPMIEKLQTLDNKKRLGNSLLKTGLKTFIYRFILFNNYEIASFNLVKNQLRNSKFLRLKYMPLVFIPILFVVIGILSDVPQLLIFNKSLANQSFFSTAILVISPSITFTMLMSSRLLISNTKILDENTSDTVWIYDSLPLKSRKLFIKGSLKYVYTYFILPATVIILILLSLREDFLTALINILFISSAIYFINSIALSFDKVYPFTLESTKFNSASKFIEVFTALVIGIILFLIQIFIFQNIIFVVTAILIFIIASWLINRN